MVCVFYTYFSHYILGKEGLSLAFSNQILKCMDKYTNMYILTAAENIFREINDIQTIEREFFLTLYRRNILLEYFFFLIE